CESTRNCQVVTHLLLAWYFGASCRTWLPWEASADSSIFSRLGSPGLASSRDEEPPSSSSCLLRRQDLALGASPLTVRTMALILVCVLLLSGRPQSYAQLAAASRLLARGRGDPVSLTRNGCSASLLS